MEKALKDILKDFVVEGNIINCKLTKIDLYKKSKKIEMALMSEAVITLKEIDLLEQYMKNKFNVDTVNIHIEYTCKPEFDIEENWKEVLLYVLKKYPLTKAILANSTIETKEKNLNVYVNVKNASEILKSRELDKVISDVIYMLSGVSYKVTYIEKIDYNFAEKFEEYQKNILETTKKEVLSNVTKKVEVSNIKNNNEIEKAPEESNIEEKPKTEIIYGRGKIENMPKTHIKDLTVDSGEVLLDGEIISMESRELKSGKELLSFNLYDGTSTVTCKLFAKDGAQSKEIQKRFKECKGIKVKGRAEYDQFAKELGVISNIVIESTGIKKNVRQDNAEVKRVELHVHTQMSQMDAVCSATDIIKRANKWGMKAIAITDHGVVQAFPEAKKAAKDTDLKVIYGVEAYLVPDKNTSVYGSKNQDIDTVYSVLDIETTGLSFRTDKITEIAAIKIKNGEIIEEFSCFVNPEIPIPEKIVEITNITNEMVKDAETIDKVMPKLIDFLGNTVVVAHNANFDLSFLRYNANLLGLNLDNTYIDTLSLSKALYPNFKKYKLGIIADKLGIVVEVAHRAFDDVITLINVFNVMIKDLKEKKAKTLDDIEAICSEGIDLKSLKSYHAIILTKTQAGLKNLYKLISFSHLKYFYKKPRIPKSLYNQYKEGLIIGSACEAGELYRAILQGQEEEDIEEIAKFYDYLEIQPLTNNNFLIRDGQVSDQEQLKEINKKIVALGEKFDKPVVATCDAHFIDPEDEIYRRILLAGQGFKEADEPLPLYIRTTEEMLEEFSYLGKEKAYEVVVTNTNKIADMCEAVNPISKDKCPPEIEGSEIQIRNISEKKAHELYGEELPDIVKERMEKELTSIIKNGFAVMYIIAQKLVWKSNADGYLVGSRGSVGSSFVAFLTGITEVNALKAHYRCPKCKYSDFSDYGIKNGFDLPDKECPKCGAQLKKDGMDIPFETFLGFDGEKEPDIDLNFSGEYQAKAHRYVDELFSTGSTFKAGTIGTIADKTAYGYVKNYFSERHLTVPSPEITRLSVGCTGIKRTTGQHPGGIIVCPAGHEIYEFCPVQHPADDQNSDIITTHFDYHSIDKNLLKLDILGHDDPTVIRMLQDITGVDPTTIPLDDKETMSIFSSTDALGVTPKQINSEVGTYGVPEFGTKFVRGMLVDTKPKTFEELIRISGLSHGTDVWLNNAQDLIINGTTTLTESICTRDDIMIYLINMHVPNKLSFLIMESVRKGKGLTEEFETAMRENNVPEWYITSCKKIKYMFPKAHAAAYVMMAFRIAWFKVHMPKAYYTAYYSIRADDFDSNFMIHGVDVAKNKMREIELLGNSATAKDKGMYSVLEIVVEMYERGLKFLPIDLYKSHATKFLMEEHGIRPPLNSVPGLGTVAAEKIDKAKEEGKFMSIEDLKLKANIGKSIIELLETIGCLNGLPKSNQMSLF